MAAHRQLGLAPAVSAGLSEGILKLNIFDFQIFIRSQVIQNCVNHFEKIIVIKNLQIPAIVFKAARLRVAACLSNNILLTFQLIMSS